MGRINISTINKLVFDLQKPARYVGGEFNQIVKQDTFIHMAISYPDLYEIGMSNNGIRVLYDIANSLEDVSCERVFAVPDDFEKKIREIGIPLYTLESFTPLSELDLIAFNISHELLYTNILLILDLGDIPILAKDRDDCHPIIIAGGEATSNPAPMNEFIDAFFIGDGEEGIIEIIEAIRISKRESLNRTQIIDLLDQIGGVYIPSKYRFVYNGGLSRIEGKIVNKRIYRGELKDPIRPILPNIRITQERSVIEATRGCKNLCKFCHAGYYDLPYRNIKPEILRDRIFQIIENTGYSDLTLSSLSISDYRFFEILLNYILPPLTERGISVSLPSMRVDKRTLPIIEQMSNIRKTSLTFAVESASDEIRRMSNKRLEIEDLLSIVRHVFDRGWRVLKLYFMIGLPGCNEHDEACSIIELLKRIYKIAGRNKRINVTISPFVPKPHTPFQWEGQMDVDYNEGIIRKIKRSLPKAIEIKNHDVRASILEGVLSRGDIFLGRVISASYKDGCRFDSWREHFHFDVWEKNLNDLIPDWDKHLSPRDEGEMLPWCFIKTGYEKLIKFNKEKISCRPKDNIIDRLYDTEFNPNVFRKSLDVFKLKYDVKQRIRIKLSKRGLAKYIPHIDFIEIIKRALRMIDAPVAFTQGHNKRERISMGYPLPVGIESICELCDVDLYGGFRITEAIIALNYRLPKGIGVVDMRFLNKKESIMAVTSAMGFSIDIVKDEFFEKCKENINSKIDFIKDGAKGSRRIKFHDAIIDYTTEINQSNHYTGSEEDPNFLRSTLEGEDSANNPRVMDVRIKVGTENSMRIDKIILALSETDYSQFYMFNILKTSQYRVENNNIVEID
ncbi:MAG: TIGR03960 family B12-binding radical SAM protein [Spirochaetota bacterium]|nr:TIGR03960 family B12-binding radical SAM protein [Spirochaetota bacterium]